MKKLITTFLLLCLLYPSGLSSKMIILEATSFTQSGNEKKSHYHHPFIKSFSVSKSIQNRTTQNRTTKEKTLKNNSLPESSYKVSINQKTFDISILDENPPLLNLKGTDLYALVATSGSAGRYYHYFKAVADDIIYLGFYPELVKVGSDQFISYESDGPRSIESRYQLKQKELTTLSQVVLP